MADLFANGVASTGQPPQNVVTAHARQRLSIGVYEVPAAGLAITDNIVFGLFKSSDRFVDIRVVVDEQGTVTTGAMNLGLWVATPENGTWAISSTGGDVDVFASAFVLSASIAYPGTSVFEEATTLETIERGQPLYTYLGLTTDPGVTYALVGDISTAVDEETDILTFTDYIAGD